MNARIAVNANNVVPPHLPRFLFSGGIVAVRSSLAVSRGRGLGVGFERQVPGQAGKLIFFLSEHGFRFCLMAPVFNGVYWFRRSVLNWKRRPGRGFSLTLSTYAVLDDGVEVNASASTTR